MKNFVFVLIMAVTLSCQRNTQQMEKPYVVEITTFKYKSDVASADYWKEDALVEELYTSKQPGFISRESGYNVDSNEVLVLVYWKTNADADASMQKFMGYASVQKFANMIDPPTMKMTRYTVK